MVILEKMEVRNRKNQKSEKSEKTPEKETITVSNNYDWDFGSIAKNKLAKIQESDPGKLFIIVISAQKSAT